MSPLLILRVEQQKFQFRLDLTPDRSPSLQMAKRPMSPTGCRMMSPQLTWKAISQDRRLRLAKDLWPSRLRRMEKWPTW